MAISLTRFQRAIDARGVTSARIEALLRERMQGRAPTRNTLARWRQTENIRREDMVRLLWAVRTASNDPTLTIEQLFDLDPNNAENWND